MYELVNPAHPDKIADRIAGAIVDLAYTKQENPRIACEVLIGHSRCYIILESSVEFTHSEIKKIVDRISDAPCRVEIVFNPQDPHLAANHYCGDNGIFRGAPVSSEEIKLCAVAKKLYNNYGTDGKYILDNCDLIICQSHADITELRSMFPGAIINPLGYWTGGINVDTGATNRKLGSDMANAVTGGGLHGKDLSKADVSVNIYLHMLAQQDNKTHEAYCHIGSPNVIIDSKSVKFCDIMEQAKKYISGIGGFEKLAEWGLHSDLIN